MAVTPTTPNPQLAVPADAIDAARELNLEYAELTRDEIRAAARRVAAPVVAAELRRLADHLGVVKNEMREVDNRNIRSAALGEGIQQLRARADELGGAAR